METLEAEIVWITISTKTRNVFFPGSIQIYMYTKNHQIEDYPRRASSREENLIAPPARSSIVQKFLKLLRQEN